MEKKRRAEAKEAIRERLNGIDRPQIPSAFEFLYEPMRYKVVMGGRGKGASWSFARVLVYRAIMRKEIILCTREVQNSIADSVHRLISDQIHSLGLLDMFEIGKTVIRCKATGSEFLFRGLSDLTVDSIKSIEGVTIIWCAEAHNMGKKSWRVLTPTIRAGGSEIWVDLNPEEEDGVTYGKFTRNAPRRSIVRHINFDQNPWFPAELEEERQESLETIANAKTDEEREQAQLDYNNVWLGHPRKISIEAIFGMRCVFEEFETPDDAVFLHGMDFGYANDPNALVRLYESDDGKELFIDLEAFGYGVELDDIEQFMDRIPTARKSKIFADCSRPETISHIKRKGFNILAAEKWQGSVEDGIAFIKGYRVIHIHSRHCPEMVKEAKNYKWKTDRVTKEIVAVPLDEHNHGWDSVRYALVKRIRQKKSFFVN